MGERNKERERGRVGVWGVCVREVVVVKKTTTKAKNGRDKQADHALNKYVTGIKNNKQKCSAVSRKCNETSEKRG